MSSEWYYRKSGQQFGPVSASELKRLAQAEELQPTDYVRKDANANWLPARNVKGLFEEAQQKAPPIARASLADASKSPTTSSAISRQGASTKKKKSPVFWIAAIGGGGFLSLMLCCGGCTIIGVFMQREARREIERADALYEIGEQAEAVAIYKENVNLAGGVKDRVYERIVQYEISTGNQVEAEKWLRKSIENDVTMEAEEGTELAVLITKIEAEIEEKKQRQGDMKTGADNA